MLSRVADARNGLTKRLRRRPLDRSRRRRDFISTRAAYRIEGRRRVSPLVAMAQLTSHCSCEVVADASCTVAALELTAHTRIPARCRRDGSTLNWGQCSALKRGRRGVLKLPRGYTTRASTAGYSCHYCTHALYEYTASRTWVERTVIQYESTVPEMAVQWTRLHKVGWRLRVSRLNGGGVHSVPRVRRTCGLGGCSMIAGGRQILPPIILRRRRRSYTWLLFRTAAVPTAV